MDLQTRDRAEPDVAPVPAGQPGVREPGDGAGAPASRDARLISRGLAVVAGLIALTTAREAGVVGKGAVPELLQAGLGTCVLFAVAGLGLTLLLLPSGLRRHWPLWVLPVGACATALLMTVLGFAAVPFRANLAIVLVAGVAVAAFALRRHGRPATAPLRIAAWPAWVAILLAAIALVPLFRAGFATVEGQGQDAHLAVGSAIFLQRHYPTSIAPEEAVDRMPLVWRSKQPIYYALAAASSLSGQEVFETISTVAAVLLAMAALGFFLLAREVLRAPPWAALAAMGLVGLDRMVLHTVMHPYFNQTWGFFAMPFAFVLAWWLVSERTVGGMILLAMFLAVMGFAYPLALPIALIPLAVLVWQERARLDVRRLYRGRRSLLWMVPLALVLIVPIRGVLEKSASAGIIFDPGRSLVNWGGDLNGWFPEPQFFGVDTWALLALVAIPLAYGVYAQLERLPQVLRRALVALLAFTLVFTIWFRIRDYGWYFHFKLLAFVAPLILVLAVSGLSTLRRRYAFLAAALLIALAVSSARTELGQTFDELPKSVLALRELDAQLPAGQSVRLDIDPQEQNWAAFMLHGQPLCSQLPLLHTSYPHVRVSRKADWIVTASRARRPRDAVAGPPARRLERYTLWKARADIPGRENCSQRMVQTVERVTT
jgi:hypothetical protein